MKKHLLLLLALAIVAIFAYTAWPQEVHTTDMRTLTMGGVSVAVNVADTEVLREQGLSGRASLAEGEGMLFIFDTDGIWGIWMKDMRFFIDIVWADSSGSVITVAHNIAPETYPKVFYPSRSARYVLELPAGFAAAHGIAEGVKMMVQ